MTKRESVKKEIFQIVIDMRAMASELEELCNKMDDMTDVECQNVADKIQEKYSAKHIELV